MEPRSCIVPDVSPSAVRTTLFVTFVAIFLATAVLTLLGITGVLEIREGYLNALFTSLILEIVAAVLALFRSLSFLGAGDAGAQARLVTGSWWELVSDKPGIAVSFVTIEYAPKTGRFTLAGDAFDDTGRRAADWTSSSAWLDPESLHLVYLWRGSETKSKQVELSGCGVIRFRVDGGELATRGFGWYVAPGDPAVAGPGRAVVEMRRATEAEQAIMRSGDAAARRDAVVSFLAKR
jgi:hypothetical protein